MTEHTQQMLRLAQRRLEREAARAETELRHGRVGIELQFQGGQVLLVRETTETTVK